MKTFRICHLTFTFLNSAIQILEKNVKTNPRFIRTMSWMTLSGLTKDRFHTLFWYFYY